MLKFLNRKLLCNLCFIILIPLTSISQNNKYQWARQTGDQFGGNDRANVVDSDADGNIVIGGTFQGRIDMDPGPAFQPIDATSNLDLYISKYDANGNHIWSKALNRTGGLFDPSIQDLALDNAGNIYVCGYYYGIIDFDPSQSADINRTPVGGVGTFIAKYDTNGNYVWVIALEGNGAFTLAIDGNNDIAVAGTFSGTVDFDPGPGIANLTSSVGADMFLAKYSEAGSYIWTKQFTGSNIESPKSLATDNTNNLFLTGNFRGNLDIDPGAPTFTITSSGTGDIFIAKFNSAGLFQTGFNLAGPGLETECYAITDASGDLYLTGHFSGTTDFDPGAGTSTLTSAGLFDIFIAKYSNTGLYQWSKRMGGTNSEAGYSIGVDASNQPYITGSFQGIADFDPGAGIVNLSTSGGEDIFLAAYDASGNYRWSYKFGSIVSEAGLSVKVDNSNQILLAGYFNQTIDFDPGAGTISLTAPFNLTSFMTARYTSNGAAILGFTGNESTGGNVTTFASATDQNENIITAGFFSGSVDFDPSASAFILNSPVYNSYVSKFSATGTHLNTIPIISTLQAQISAIEVDVWENIIITGSFQGIIDLDPGPGTSNFTSVGNSDLFLAKYDPDGNYLWGKTLGGSSTEYSLTLNITHQDEIFISGLFGGTFDADPGPGSSNLVAAGGGDIFFAKFDANGNFIWAKNIGGSAADFYNDRVFSSETDLNGNFLMTGYFKGTVDFDPGASTSNLVSAGLEDAFIVKYDVSGNFIFAKNIGNASSEFGIGIKTEISGNIIITGFYAGTVDFDPGPSSSNLSSVSGSTDVYLAKYDPLGNFIWARSIGGTSYDSPNSLKLDGMDQPYITGTFNQTADFDPSASVFNLTSAGSSDIFVARYDNSGNFIWAMNIGGIASESLNGGFTLDYESNPFLSSYLQGKIDFDPSAGIANMVAPISGAEKFQAKYGCSSISLASTNQVYVMDINKGHLFYWSQNCDNLVAKLVPSGTNPARNLVTGKVWIESSVPVYFGQPFVSRHYEITPTNNTATATGRVTLYFTQQEFTDFNSHPGSQLNLPTGPADFAGIANLRIGKYSGTSSNNSGLPGTYTGNVTILDPQDSDIIWDAANNRWSVSFDVVGFSGFIVQTLVTPLPVKVIEFSGVLNQHQQAVLKWDVRNQEYVQSYTVEKSSDGHHFEKAGVVSGNQVASFLYHFIDSIPVSKENFYRLSILENNHITYSKIIKLENLNLVKLNLYPVPAQNDIVIQIPNNRLPVTIRILGSGGELIQKQIIYQSTYKLHINKLPKGVYTIQTDTGEAARFIHL